MAIHLVQSQVETHKEGKLTQGRAKLTTGIFGKCFFKNLHNSSGFKIYRENLQGKQKFVWEIGGEIAVFGFVKQMQVKRLLSLVVGRGDREIGNPL